MSWKRKQKQKKKKWNTRNNVKWYENRQAIAIILSHIFRCHIIFRVLNMIYIGLNENDVALWEPETEKTKSFDQSRWIELQINLINKIDISTWFIWFGIHPKCINHWWVKRVKLKNINKSNGKITLKFCNLIQIKCRKRANVNALRIPTFCN